MGRVSYNLSFNLIERLVKFFDGSWNEHLDSSFILLIDWTQGPAGFYKLQSIRGDGNKVEKGSLLLTMPLNILWRTSRGWAICAMFDQ